MNLIVIFSPGYRYLVLNSKPSPLSALIFWIEYVKSPSRFPFVPESSTLKALPSIPLSLIENPFGKSVSFATTLYPTALGFFCSIVMVYGISSPTWNSYGSAVFVSMSPGLGLSPSSFVPIHTFVCTVLVSFGHSALPSSESGSRGSTSSVILTLALFGHLKRTLSVPYVFAVAHFARDSSES